MTAACISRFFCCLTICRSVGSLLRGSWNERVVKKGRCFAGLPIQQSFWHSTGPESISKPAERPHARCGSGRRAGQAASPEAKKHPPTCKRAEEEAQGASRDPEVRPATFRKTKRGTQKQKPGDFLAKERASWYPTCARKSPRSLARASVPCYKTPTSAAAGPRRCPSSGN